MIQTLNDSQINLLDSADQTAYRTLLKSYQVLVNYDTELDSLTLKVLGLQDQIKVTLVQVSEAQTALDKDLLAKKDPSIIAADEERLAAFEAELRQNNSDLETARASWRALKKPEGSLETLEQQLSSYIDKAKKLEIQASANSVGQSIAAKETKTETTVTTDTSATTENTAKEEKSFKVDPQAIKDTSESENARLTTLASYYGFILGGDLILNYAHLYENNLNECAKNQVKSNLDSSKDVKGNQMVRFKPLATTKVDAPKETIKASNGSTTTLPATKLEIPSSAGSLFSEVKPIPEASKPAFDFLSSSISGPHAESLAAHANVSSGLQPIWPLAATNQNEAEQTGVGMFGLRSSVVKQTDPTQFLGLTFPAQSVPTTSSEMEALVLENRKNLFISDDPRLDPKQSAEIALKINQNFASNLDLKPVDLHPDFSAYCCRLGASDPALALTVQEVDPQDKSVANRDVIANSLKANMFKLGGYSQADQDYVDKYRLVKENAEKTGIHDVTSNLS